ncbi:MAG: RNA polymerase sigma factor [Lachnospiraceae bacterium]|nr:RNA polymerase sigma factor [Lachnospiraceae bacterium]
MSGKNALELNREDIIREYSPMVYRLAFARTGSKSDADDIYQEVFLRFLQREKSFESKEHLKAWLIRVTINLALKLQTSAWFRKTESLEEHLGFLEQICETHQELQLWQEVDKLRPKYRTVIHLFYYEGFSAEEISGMLKQKPSTVRTWLTRARQQLRAVLEEK